jgi:hypothetical protein
MTPEQARRLTLAEQHAWYRRFASRRALLRSGVAGPGTLIAGPALLGGTAAAGTADRRRPASPMLLAKSSWISGSAAPAPPAARPWRSTTCPSPRPGSGPSPDSPDLVSAALASPHRLLAPVPSYQV